MKKVSSVFVIAAMMAAMVFMSCKNNADGENNDANFDLNRRSLSSAADIYVLGSYGDANGTLSFNDDGTGSYKAGGSSSSIRAGSGASIPNFSWSATKSGNTTIITIKYSGKTGTLTRDNAGKISGQLDDSASSSVNMGPRPAKESDYIGKTATLELPLNKLDPWMPLLGTCPISLKFYSDNIKVTDYGRNWDSSDDIPDAEEGKKAEFVSRVLFNKDTKNEKIETIGPIYEGGVQKPLSGIWKINNDGTLKLFYSYSDNSSWWCRFSSVDAYVKIHGVKVYVTITDPRNSDNTLILPYTMN